MVVDLGTMWSGSKATHVRFFFFSSRRRHTRFDCDWSSDVCSSDLAGAVPPPGFGVGAVAGAAVRGAGEGLQVGPVHGQRRAGGFELGGGGWLPPPVAEPRGDFPGGAPRAVPFPGARGPARGGAGAPA